jgi:hypothetical protein
MKMHLYETCTIIHIVGKYLFDMFPVQINLEQGSTLYPFFTGRAEI